MTACGRWVWWWDIDIAEQCTRPAHHTGSHTDGLWWFDDNGIRVPVDHATDDDAATEAVL